MSPRSEVRMIAVLARVKPYNYGAFAAYLDEWSVPEPRDAFSQHYAKGRSEWVAAALLAIAAGFECGECGDLFAQCPDNFRLSPGGCVPLCTPCARAAVRSPR